MLAARFQYGELCAAIDLHVRIRIGHRIQMACLAREVEQVLMVPHEKRQAVFIAYVRNVHPHIGFDAGEVE